MTNKLVSLYFGSNGDMKDFFVFLCVFFFFFREFEITTLHSCSFGVPIHTISTAQGSLVETQTWGTCKLSPFWGSPSFTEVLKKVPPGSSGVALR